MSEVASALPTFDASSIPSTSMSSASGEATSVKAQADESSSDEEDETKGKPALTEQDLKAKKAAKKKRKQEAAKRKKAQAAAAAASNTTLPSSITPSHSPEFTASIRMDGLQASFPNNSMHAYFNDNDNSTKLAFSRTKGRHVLATRPIPAGHSIFRMSAYAAVVNDAYIRTFCHCCFQPSVNLSACSSCLHARYCSAKCKNAMASIHHLECDALGRLKLLALEEESAPIRMLIRICYLQYQEKLASEKKHKPKPGQSFADCLSLISHIEDQSHESKAHILRLLLDLQRRVVRDEAVWRSGEFDLQTCIKVLFQIQCNAHHITDTSKVKIGLGLFIPAAYLNHSCDPNCIYWFDETGRMVLQSIRLIAVGEEITYAYIDLYQPRELRSQLLRNAFFIQECQCDRCKKTSEKVAPEMLMRGMICSSCGTNPLIEYKEACESGKMPLSVSNLPLLKYDKSHTGSMYCPMPNCGKVYKKMDIDALIYSVQWLSEQAFLSARGGAQLEAVQNLETGILYLTRLTTSSTNQPFFHPYHYALFNTYSHLVSILASIPNPSVENCVRTLRYVSAMLECLLSQGFGNHPEAADALKIKGDVLMRLEKYSRTIKDICVHESPVLVRKEPSSAEVATAGLEALSITQTTPAELTKLAPILPLRHTAFQCYSASMSLRTLLFGKAHTLTKSVDAKIADMEKAYGKMKLSCAESEPKTLNLKFDDFEDASQAKKKRKNKSKQI